MNLEDVLRSGSFVTKNESPVEHVRPCPFCGGDAAMKHSAGSWGYYPGKDWVECLECHAKGPEFDDDTGYGQPFVSKQLAIDYWNRRKA